MTIIGRLRTEFPGITAMIAGIQGALKALHAYNRALKHIEALTIKDPINAWAWKVSEHSMLSYKDAHDIHDYLLEHPEICKHIRNMVTEFVIEMANYGYTGDMILKYLVQTDKELDLWAFDMLSISIEKVSVLKKELE